jgi:DNA-directed RNA polymerase sigma subunit (sigma70/sigma32)
MSAEWQEFEERSRKALAALEGIAKCLNELMRLGTLQWAKLSHTERRIIEVRFGVTENGNGTEVTHTIQETSEILQITIAKVRQTEARALRKLGYSKRDHP